MNKTIEITEREALNVSLLIDRACDVSRDLMALATLLKNFRHDEEDGVVGEYLSKLLDKMAMDVSLGNVPGGGLPTSLEDKLKAAFPSLKRENG